MSTEESTELPERIEELDRLRLENAQLRLMNLQGTHKSLVAKVAALEAEIDSSQVTYAKMLCELALKYKFDPNTDQMEPETGRLLRARKVHTDTPPV